MIPKAITWSHYTVVSNNTEISREYGRFWANWLWRIAIYEHMKHSMYNSWHMLSVRYLSDGALQVQNVVLYTQSIPLLNTLYCVSLQRFESLPRQISVANLLLLLLFEYGSCHYIPVYMWTLWIANIKMSHRPFYIYIHICTYGFNVVNDIIFCSHHS